MLKRRAVAGTSGDGSCDFMVQFVDVSVHFAVVHHTPNFNRIKLLHEWIRLSRSPTYVGSSTLRPHREWWKRWNRRKWRAMGECGMRGRDEDFGWRNQTTKTAKKQRPGWTEPLSKSAWTKNKKRVNKFSSTTKWLSSSSSKLHWRLVPNWVDSFCLWSTSHQVVTCVSWRIGANWTSRWA